MPLLVRSFSDARALLDRSLAHLMRREAENNLDRIARGESAFDASFLATVEADPLAPEPLCVAMRTPPHNLALSPTTPDAASALALYLRSQGVRVPGVSAEIHTAAAFAQSWIALTGATSRVAMSQRIHRLTRVLRPPSPAGAARPARADDVEKIAEWLGAFEVDAHIEVVTPLEQRRARASALVSRGDLWLWDDGAPVSMCGRVRNTPNGGCVAMVYTPPALRGRGYATALVAAFSQSILDEGRRFCFLYTDLANPTSNAIYARIGYEPVCDATMISFAE
jgi:uncharacterized protein